jgi:hypothetical protein
MAAGIYIYTFSSGAQYVGQAVDIEDRWEQHIKKMYAGKHTKLIQAEYNRCGFPELNTLMICHPHYLDAMEALYINNIKPVLNTAIPKTYLTKDIKTEIRQDTLETSAYDVLSRHDQLEEELEIKETELVELEERIKQIATEKLPEESKQLLREAQKEVRLYKAEAMSSTRVLSELQHKINRYNSETWWYRLWNKV